MTMRRANRFLVIVLLGASAILAGVMVAGAVDVSPPTPAATAPASALSPAKKAAQDQENGFWNNAKAQHTPAPKHPEQIVASCPEALPTPIITVAPGPSGYAKGYADTNSIAQLTGTDRRGYTLFGGSLLSDPSQGVVMVLQMPVDDCAVHQPDNLQDFLTPARSGAVTFTRIQGDVIYFGTANGTQGAFNVLSHQFQ